jgi:hypothetical protein
MQLGLVFTVLAFVQAATASLSTAWTLMDVGRDLPQQTMFYVISVLAPLLAGIFSMVNAMAAPTYGNKDRANALWLFTIFSVLSYVFIYLDIDTILFNSVAFDRTNLTTTCIFAFIAVIRTLLEFFLCRLRIRTRSNATKVSCRIGSTTAKVLGLMQVLACLAVTALYICCLMRTL